MAIDSFQGIPDEYDGSTISKRHQLVGGLPSFTAGKDGYIIMLPVPGVAYFWGERTAGDVSSAMALTAVKYSDFSTLFATGSEAIVVNNFRYASSVLEIIPTVNAMSWTGSIQVFKGRCKGVFAPTATTTNFFEVEGLDVLNSTKPDNVLPFNHGMYAPTRCTEADYPWNPIMTSCDISKVIGPNPAGNFTFTGMTNFTGFGCQEAVVVKIPAYAAVDTAILRTWACVEYQVSSSSILYEYTHASPVYDPLALQLLTRFFKEHPTAVPYYDNDSFWQNFLKWAKTITGALKVIPGPVGEAAGIGESIANLVGDLVL